MEWHDAQDPDDRPIWFAPIWLLHGGSPHPSMHMAMRIPTPDIERDASDMGVLGWPDSADGHGQTSVWPEPMAWAYCEPPPAPVLVHRWEDPK